MNYSSTGNSGYRLMESVLAQLRVNVTEIREVKESRERELGEPDSPEVSLLINAVESMLVKQP